jgi:predicted nucleotidyltransferase component of viral defense system
MIDRNEIRRRARRLGVTVDHIERDYVLNHVLAAISADPAELIFRGGTALARVYWPDFRLSEDLDFITMGDQAAAHQVIEPFEMRASPRGCPLPSMSDGSGPG